MPDNKGDRNLGHVLNCEHAPSTARMVSSTLRIDHLLVLLAPNTASRGGPQCCTDALGSTSPLRLSAYSVDTGPKVSSIAIAPRTIAARVSA